MNYTNEMQSSLQKCSKINVELFLLSCIIRLQHKFHFELFFVMLTLVAFYSFPYNSKFWTEYNKMTFVKWFPLIITCCSYTISRIFNIVTAFVNENIRILVGHTLFFCGIVFLVVTYFFLKLFTENHEI